MSYKYVLSFLVITCFSFSIWTEKDSSEWISLFDGTSFENWRGYLQEDMPRGWIIEENAMLFMPTQGVNGNIITKEKYTNFILQLE